MPGRFSNLELHDHAQQGAGEIVLHQRGGYDASYYLFEAVQAYRLSRFEAALQMYTRCLERDRAVIPAWVGQVQMLVQLDECSEARLWANKALELFRNNGELLAAKAQACTRLNDRRAGYACCDAALQSPGSSPWRWQVRGEVLLANGAPHHEECFRRSLNEQAADWFDHIVIARIFRYYDRATNALAYVKSALALDETEAAVWLEKGNCQAALGLTPAARTSYQRCLELYPGLEAARAALGILDSFSLLDWLKSRFRGGRRR